MAKLRGSNENSAGRRIRQVFTCFRQVVISGNIGQNLFAALSAVLDSAVGTLYCKIGRSQKTGRGENLCVVQVIQNNRSTVVLVLVKRAGSLHQYTGS